MRKLSKRVLGIITLLCIIIALLPIQTLAANTVDVQLVNDITTVYSITYTISNYSGGEKAILMRVDCDYRCPADRFGGGYERLSPTTYTYTEDMSEGSWGYTLIDGSIHTDMSALAIVDSSMEKAEINILTGFLAYEVDTGSTGGASVLYCQLYTYEIDLTTPCGTIDSVGNVTPATPYPVTGGNIYFDVASKTILDCDKNVTQANIPSAINGVSVEHIGSSAFSGCNLLNSITLPDSIYRINNYAFKDCESLSDVYYLGSEEQWNTIIIGAGNESLLDANIQYEHSEEIFPNKYNFFNDSYNFTNYGEKLNKDYFTTIYEEGPGTALYNIKKNSGKGGLCFGMAYTTAAIYNGFPDCSLISTIDENIFDFKMCDNIREIVNYNFPLFPDISSAFVVGHNTITIDDYIKYAFVYQWSSEVAESTNRTWGDIQGLYKTVKEFTDSNIIGVTIGITHFKQDSQGNWISDGGHRVLAVGYDGNDILVDDPNNCKALERLSVNDDGTWTYSGAWTSDGVNSNNSVTRYQLDYYRPYQILWSGKETTLSSNLLQETDVIKSSEDDLLLYLDNSDAASLPTTAKEVKEDENIGINSRSDGEYKGKLYWIEDSDSVTVSNLLGSSNTAILANDNTILSVEESQFTELTATVNENIQDVDFEVINNTPICLSYTTVTPTKDIEIRVSGLVEGKNVSAESDVDGLAVKGLSHGTVELLQNDVLVSSVKFSDSNYNIEISYDKTGSSGNMDVVADVVDGSVRVTGVELNTHRVELNQVGSVYQIDADVTPINATNQAVTWTSSNSRVATVTDAGLVTAVSNGVTTITATTQDGGYTATCEVTVELPEDPNIPVLVTGVELNASSVDLNQIGDVYQLEADVTPINATNQAVTWESSNPNVATVSDAGLVTAVSNGVTTITATTQDGGYTATCEVRVELMEDPNVPVTGVELNTQRITLSQIGNTYQLEANVTPINATNQAITWASSNPNIATVTDTGLVTAVSEGTATITVTTEDGQKVATCTVTVRIESGSGGTGGGGSSGSTTPASYTITSEYTVGGAITISPKTASKGQTVTITAVPDDGFALKTLSVTDKNGNKIELTKQTETSYTFKMPASKVTVSAIFTEIVVEPEPIILPFDDISQSAWYYGAVEYVYSNDMMQGTSATTFSPEVEMSRGMIATVLYRLENTPALTGSTSFSDVGGNEWYTDAIQWAAENNIMSGYGNNRFGPMDSVTREQLAVILYNYTASNGISVEAAGDLSVFHDAEDTSDWAEEAISWAVGVGLLSGKGNGILDPTGTATRAEVAQMLMNYCTKVV